MIKKIIFVLLASLILSRVQPANSKTNWMDTFYQYRLGLVFEVDQVGWNIIPIDESTITASVNMGQEMTYDPIWFAYNHLKVIEVDQADNVINDVSDAGFYLVPKGEELFTAKITGEDQIVTIPTKKDAYYLVRYKSQDAGISPLVKYDQVFPIGETLRTQAYMSSYEAALLPLSLKQNERLLKSDGEPMEITLKDRHVTNVKDVSVKEVTTVFLAKVDTVGEKYFVMYYQPQSGLFLKIPQLRKESMPKSTAVLKRLANAEKYMGSTVYQLAKNNSCAVWFADSTVKITPNTAVPSNTAKVARVSAAKNEAQSFQLILSPEKELKFKDIKASSLVKGKSEIASINFAFKALEYVNIQKSSYITPVKFLGTIADPLVEVQKKQVSPLTGNIGFWITLKVPAETPAGIYKGQIVINCSGVDKIKIPIEVEVYDFELPEFASFQSSMGLQFVTKNIGGGRRPFLEYHGLETKEQAKKIFQKYCEAMAENKFYPKTVALYSEIGMKWSPPPKGYNVDEPNNFFCLYEWDFSEFNKEMQYYIDKLKVNSVSLEHNNPIVANMFKHLPGDNLEMLFDAPPHMTMAWQTFREHTYVVWGKEKGDSFYDETIEITKKQFDRLLLDYFRAIAENLEKHGWLDKFYIQIDETSNVERILHFMRLLKSDSLIAKIKIVGCMQGLEYLYYKDYPDSNEYSFNGLVTYVPQNDEGYQRWEDYFWDEYNLPIGREYLWNYAVTGSRLEIDVPGVNNRMIALDIFDRGGSGLLDWEVILWDSWYTGDNNNPWKNPYSVEGNGVLSYFYPPSKNGISDKPNYTVVPSLRVETFRESVDDYEYALILENLIKHGKKKGIDVSDAENVIADISRFFDSAVSWSQNDAWYLELRDRMAQSIVELKECLKNE